MKKIITLVMATVLMIMTTVNYTDLYDLGMVADDVSAEEYEKNIKLTIESKDIDINEIPDDRKVELLVSIENNPGFRGLFYTIKFDSVLRDQEREYIKPLYSEQSENDVWPSAVSVFESGEVEFQLDAIPLSSVFTEDGPMMYLVFKLPSDVKPGDLFVIEFIRENTHRSGLWFFPDREKGYTSEYFSDLNNGVIRIVGETTEPVTQTPADLNNNDGMNSENDINNNLSTSESKETEAVNTKTVSSTTVSETTSTAVSTTASVYVESTTAPVTSTSVNSETTKPETNISSKPTTKAENVSTVAEENEDKEEKKSVFPMVIILIVLAAVILGIVKGTNRK